ncbi:alpha/beta hydrolase [Lysobacter hankyongensis]|uniref:Alpha/beta hydrolase-fold protein n=1 Tax=Lysobacter hankyongensis TaxID=1176535 RepID=A0ABP9AK36_9GAMM
MITKARIGPGAAALVGLALCGAGFVAGRYAEPSARIVATHATTARPQAAPAAANDVAIGYTLPNTRVHPLPNAATGRKYEVWVDLPPSYFENDRPYPVVFTTDADYGFPLIRSLRRRIGAKGRNVEDFVLVGLSYGIGEQSMPSKRRDYTPTDPFARGDVAAGDYDRASTYGQAAAYRDYIERDVFPLIAREYRVDMQRKIYIGHSLGGLFGTYVLLTKPAMFRHYILGSPSLWFDRRTIFDLEAEYAAAHRDLSADVLLSIGAYETTGNGPRYLGTDMVGDMHRFERVLESRGYPALRVDSEVLPDEDHLTVLPRTITHGLRWALPGTGPYEGG